MGKVIQQTDTAQPESMPALDHLWRRNGVYYFRMLLPRELKRRGVVFYVDGRKQSHEIKFSLKTSTYKAAASAVALHSAIWRAKFDEKLREVEEMRLSRHAREQLFAARKAGILPEPTSTGGASILVSDEFIRRIVLRHFISLQKESALRIEDLRDRPEIKEEVIGDISLENSITRDDEFSDSQLRAELRQHLKNYNLDELSDTSVAFAELLRGYRAAKAEDAKRTIAEITGGTAIEFDPVFKGVNALTPMPDDKGEFTLGAMIAAFEKAQLAKGVVEKTLRSDTPVFAALKEHFGEHMPVHMITPERMTGFFDFMDTIPAHASKRYKKMTLKEAAASVKGKADVELLEHRTKANYHSRVVAMYEYSTSMGWVNFNPAKIKPLLDRFHVQKKSDREPFTLAEISAIFHAPLYTGCKNGGQGWSEKGPRIFRHGRFWVPLLALFQGFRCNEACQLEAADVLLNYEGLPCISITDQSKDETAAKGKSVKNSSSRAKVPIHPMLIRMGFLDFVKARIDAGDDSRLFPELSQKKDGNYSDNFSKWFARFLDKTFPNEKPEATFHGFRHAFRDAMRRAQIHMEIQDRLGRWTTGGGVGRFYGSGYPMSVLLDELKKVEYPKVEFAHLFIYTESGCPVRLRA